MSRAKEGALKLARKGFPVFPVIRDGKKPALPGWKEWALESTPEKIAQSNHTGNWGVLCDGLVVVDVDPKGFESLDSLALEETTFTVRTPRGGLHFYYTGQARPKVNLVPGIDIRGDSSYVVAPGSMVAGIEYRIENHTSLKPVPGSLQEKLSTIKHTEIQTDECVLREPGRNHGITKLAGAMRRSGMGFDAIYAAIEKMNETQINPPFTASEMDTEVRKTIQSVCSYTPDTVETALVFGLGSAPGTKPEIPIFLRASEIDPATIPPRDWVMDGVLIGGFVSVLVAPGGLGKSTVSLLDAMAICSGQNLSGHQVVKPGAVWFMNLEDPKEEMQRRVTAMASCHNIPLQSLDNLLITGSEFSMVIAKETKAGIVFDESKIGLAIETIRENNVVALYVDPFVSAHEVEENSNGSINKVVEAFKRIARETGCGVSLVHHTAKGVHIAGDVNSARGAGSLIYSARAVRTLTAMTEQEAKTFGIEPDMRTWYMRVDPGKTNLQPPAESAEWYKRESIQIKNGDNVGALARVDLCMDMEANQRRRDQGNCTQLALQLEQMMIDMEDLPITRFITEMDLACEAILPGGAAKQKKELTRLLKMNPETRNCVFGYEYREEKEKHWIRKESKP